MDLIIPSEIWEQIFKSLAKIRDITHIMCICKGFRNIVRKCIYIIDDDSKVTIPKNIMNLYPNLTSCTLKNGVISSDALAAMLGFVRILDVKADFNTIKNVWIPYWLKQDQKTFNSIHHQLQGYGNMNINIHINNGVFYLKGLGSDLSNIIRLLTQKFLIKFYNMVGCGPDTFLDISQITYPNKIGVILDVVQSSRGILDILILRRNIKYIGINHNQLWAKRGKTLQHYFTKDFICLNQVTIDIPIPCEFVDEFHRRLPNMKEIRVISTGFLPKIHGVKVTGYNPITMHCFQ